MKHFLTENDFDRNEIIEVFEQAYRFKNNRAERPSSDLAGQSWGMLFYKNSTRTRVSFEVGIRELGGSPLVIDQDSTQIGRGESIEDTVRVLSRYLDGLIIRTHGHDIIEEFARHSSIPVVNALTDFLHPCQIYADCMTILEKNGGELNPFDGLQGKKLAFFGDTSCNMANSWILAGALFGMEIHLAGPSEFQPQERIQAFCKENGLPRTWHFTTDPMEAANEARRYLHRRLGKHGMRGPRTGSAPEDGPFSSGFGRPWPGKGKLPVHALHARSSGRRSHPRSFGLAPRNSFRSG